MIDRIIFYIFIGLTLLGCSSDSEEGGELCSVPLIQIFQEFNSCLLYTSDAADE